MGSLFGSAPKASFSTQSTVSPTQQSIMEMLQNYFEFGGMPPGVSGYSGSFAAPLSGLENTSLAALENAVNTVAQLGAEGAAYQAPKIDSTEAFRTGVVQPVTNDFLGRTLPSIAGKYGAGAGGAFSSDALGARQTASEDVARALSETGSKFAYDASKANQAADLAAAGVRQSSGTSLIQSLLGALQGGAVPRQVQQTELTGRYQDWLSQLNQRQSLLANMIAAATGTTQQTVGVGSGGSSGLIPGLLGGVAGNSGLGTALGGWLFSDERLKTSFRKVGEVEGIPLYSYRFKGSDERQLGFLAQDVECRMPEAVAETREGVKLVNYGAVLSAALEA